MLRQLMVRNFGLAKEIDLEFVPGANIITGETGSGKTILLDALALVLGERADGQQWDSSDGKTVIEATFEVLPQTVQDWLTTHELDAGETLLLRREIQPAGRSRTFINDTPVNLSLLKTLGTMLVNVHTQHQTSEWFDAGYGYKMVDAFAGIQALASAYDRHYKKFTALRREIETLKQQIKLLHARKDFLNFQLEELDKAGLENPEELNQLESEVRLLENMSTIKSKLYRLSNGVNEEQGLLDKLGALISEIRPVGKYSEALGELTERLNTLFLEVKDIGSSAEQLNDDLLLEEERLNEVRERLDLLIRLMRKHQLSALEQLIHLRDEFRNEVLGAEADQQKLDQLMQELEIIQQELKKLAGQLHDQRAIAVVKMEKELSSLLKEVGLADAVLRFELTQQDTCGPYPAAASGLQMLFAANRGYAPKPLKEVASGGELSRLMLCFKSLLAGKLEGSSLVFDEIDAGISGEAALRVSRLLNKISKKQQVICITHLPQTARIADAHILIRKYLSEQHKTYTSAKRLSPEEQEEQLARMIAGEKFNQEALQTARQLINSKTDSHE